MESGSVRACRSAGSGGTYRGEKVRQKHKPDVCKVGEKKEEIEPRGGGGEAQGSIPGSLSALYDTGQGFISMLVCFAGPWRCRAALASIFHPLDFQLFPPPALCADNNGNFILFPRFARSFFPLFCPGDALATRRGIKRRGPSTGRLQGAILTLIRHCCSNFHKVD